MKKTLIFLFMCLPLMAMAQTTLTPEQQLEQAQRQLEEAKAALEKAKQNAAKAKTEAAEKAKKDAEAIQRKIAETKAETERVAREAAKIREEANKDSNKKEGTTTDSTTKKEGNSNAWVVPTTPDKAAVKANNKVADSKNTNDIYLQPGIVPEVNGQVIWTEDVNVPGATATELYDKAYAYLTKLTEGSNQLEGSKVALVNKNEHSIIATIREKLIFSSTFLSLDYTQCNYVLQATCKDGLATLSMSRITYSYDVQGNVTNYTAEKWITDHYSMNKKQTRLLPVSGKFRKATIDHKDSIFQGFREALQ